MFKRIIEEKKKFNHLYVSGNHSVKGRMERVFIIVNVFLTETCF